jgi:ELWxxDGT repeat protein
MRKKLPFHLINDTCSLMRAACVLFFFCIISSHSALAQATLLVDTDDSEELHNNEYSELRNGNNALYFISEGKKLWISTGETDSADNPVLLKTFDKISMLTPIGSSVYFVADDGTSGAELWRTNGTEGGTVLIKDIRAGATGSEPDQLTNVNGVLYFVANDGNHGKEIWRSNGTSTGTIIVKDVYAKGGSSNPSSLINANGSLFFAANDGVNGYELWKSDGTVSGTLMVKDIKPGSKISSAPAMLTNVNGIVFFVAADTESGRELWKSDGTYTGTVRVKDIRMGINTSSIDNTVAVSDKLFFTASDGIHGHELWKSDGTEAGTVLVKDMTPGSSGSNGEYDFTYKMGNFTNINGTLFYTAYKNNDYYIWKSDGTTAGTVTLQIANGPGIAQPKPKFTVMNGRIYYINQPDAYENINLWSMDLNGTNAYSILDLFVDDAYNTYYPEIASVKNHLYISGKPSGWEGYKIIKTDGTYDGAVWFDVLQATGSGEPHDYNFYNGKIYFISAQPFYDQSDLYRTDGTPSGTAAIANYSQRISEIEIVGNNVYASAEGFYQLYKTDLNTLQTTVLREDYSASYAYFLRSADGLLYYTNPKGELWRTDGTEKGTRMLKDFYRIASMDVVAGKIMFRVVNEDWTEELWRTNGTLAGTFKLKTLHEGYVRMNATSPTAVIGNTYYFVANDGVHGNELWKSSGTASSTMMVKDINTQEVNDWSYEYDIRSFVVFRDSLYLSAKNNNNVWALFKSNGTASGTKEVVQLSVMKMFADVNRLFLFAERDNGASAELWISNGTNSGTHLVNDLNRPYSDYGAEFVNGKMYFSSVSDPDLWRTDGTSCGTTTEPIGTRTAFPMIALNNTLIFTSFRSDVGSEPFSYILQNVADDPCRETLAATHDILTIQDEKLISSYPNPFTHNFNLDVRGSVDDVAEINVFTITGNPVEKIKTEDLNRNNTLGQSWPTGMYLLKINKGGKLITHMVVKR